MPRCPFRMAVIRFPGTRKARASALADSPASFMISCRASPGCTGGSFFLLLAMSCLLTMVVLDFPLDFARSFPANYPEFPDSCLLFDLPFLVDVLEMLVDGPDILLEQLRDERLAQPERFVDKAALDPRAAVFCPVQDHLARRGCGII